MQENQNTVIKINFLKDPITNLLFVKYGSNGYLFVVVLLIFMPLYVASIIENGFWEIDIANELNVNAVPMVSDIGIIMQLIYLILLGVFINAFFKNLNKHFSNLWENKIFITNDVKIYEKHLHKYELRSNNNKLYLLSGFFFFITFLYDMFIESDIVDVIFTSNSPFYPLTKKILLIGGGIQGFMFGIFLWKIFVLIDLMNTICDNSTFSLKDLNPGTTYSLHPMGDIIYELSRIVLLFSYTPLSSILFAIYWQPDVSGMFLYRAISTSILYVFLSILIFIYPLMPSHLFMKNEKGKLLADIKLQYKNLSYKIFKGGSIIIENSNKQAINDFILIKNLHTEISNMQEWPLNTAFIIEMTKSIILPLTLTIVQAIVTYYIF